MPFDIERIRAETPGCTRVAHFNNAGASLPAQPVLDTVFDHLRLEAECGGYEAADARRDALDGAYTIAAQLIGGKPDEIAFVENATRAWDMAFYALDWRAGDRILTAKAEYASNYIAYLQVARRHGVEIVTVPDDETGQISVPALQELIDERTRLISITHIPTNGGLVNPASEVGAIARAHDIPFLLDTCQSVGQIPIDVAEIGCDMLSATGRKYLRGPRGTGFLWIRRDLADTLEPPLLDLHAALWTGPNEYEIVPGARRFENWEYFVAGRLGLARAIEYALDLGMETIRDRIYLLAGRLRQGLAELPGVTLRDKGAEQCGIVSFTLDGRSPADIKQALAAKNINVSASRRGSTLLDMTDRGLTDVVRASVHYYNTEQEVDRLCAEIAALS